jgi:hypothetical protein
LVHRSPSVRFGDPLQNSGQGTPRAPEASVESGKEKNSEKPKKEKSSDAGPQENPGTQETEEEKKSLPLFAARRNKTLLLSSTRKKNPIRPPEDTETSLCRSEPALGFEPEPTEEIPEPPLSKSGPEKYNSDLRPPSITVSAMVRSGGTSPLQLSMKSRAIAATFARPVKKKEKRTPAASPVAPRVEEPEETQKAPTSPRFLSDTRAKQKTTLASSRSCTQHVPATLSALPHFFSRATEKLPEARDPRMQSAVMTTVTLEELSELLLLSMTQQKDVKVWKSIQELLSSYNPFSGVFLASLLMVHFFFESHGWTFFRNPNFPKLFRFFKILCRFFATPGICGPLKNISPHPYKSDFRRFSEKRFYFW